MGQEEQSELDLYQDHEFFEKVKVLARPYDQVYRCDTQAKLMEDALNIIMLVSSEQKRKEITRIIAARDPIMWYLLCSNANIDVGNFPPEVVLKKFIMTLNIFRTKIDKEYQNIIEPKLWGKSLKEEYKEFEQFAEDNIYKQLSEMSSAVQTALSMLILIFIFVVFIIKYL